MVAANTASPRRPLVWIVIGVVDEGVNRWMSFQGPFFSDSEAGLYAYHMRNEGRFTHVNIRRLACVNPEFIDLEDGDFLSNCCEECGGAVGRCDCCEECDE